jgi:alpha-tubulin suppressor-like RCC1 family protein
MRRRIALAAALLACAGCRDIPFYCSTDEQCVRDGKPGWCEKNHRCSFEDSGGCPSGRRFAPFDTGETCVPPPPACAVLGVAAGANFSCAWSNTGKVSCWGDNGNGQLGDGTTVSRSKPARIALSNVVEVAAGAVHACARHDDGAVSCWGDNSVQQLGVADGNAGNRSMPLKLRTIENVRGLAAGGRHTCALRGDGSLWCWGRNNLGQIGDGGTINRDRPTRVMSRTNDIKQVAAGDTHTCALIGDGTLACWGGIRTLGLAPGLLPAQTLPASIDGLPPSSRLVAGDTHTCALADGGVYCFGLSDLGQAGERVAGRTVGPTRITGMDGATDLDAGSTHTCAVVPEAARCWGGGSFGQLGVPRIDSGASVKPSPAAPWKQIAAGLRHTCALTAVGEVFCWGRAGEGQLGDGAPVLWTAPQPLVELRDLTALAAGSEHTCALSRTGLVFCWGRGDYGQLASTDVAGSSTPVAVSLPGVAVQISAGGAFTCARLADGDVVCWGRGNRGQIGDGANADRRRATPVMLTEKVVHIATGTDHACAASVTGAVYCWGEAAGGRLGNGMMAGMAQNRPLLVPNVSDIVQVGAGNAHSCALGRDGQVICWGMSNFGQAGIAPPGTMPVPPTPLAGLSDVNALALGGDHACALTGAAVLWCWGKGDSGQLGFGTIPGLAQPVAISNLGPVSAVSAASNHTCAVAGGASFCWGQGRFGQLGGGNTSSINKPTAVMKLATGVVAIEGGDRHSCGLLADGTAHCWGSNQFGQLGTGVPLERTMPVQVTLECP